MSIQSELYSLLSGTAAITAITSTRIYPQISPKNTTTPYIVYFIIGSNKSYSHDGYANVNRFVMQVSCYATTYDVACDLYEKVVTALHSWSKKEVFIMEIKDLYENDSKYYHTAITFNVVE